MQACVHAVHIVLLLLLSLHACFPHSENSTSMDEDSDSEADRRLALLFKDNEVISPQEDKIIMDSQCRTHLRAKSLPPPMQLRVDTCDQEEEEEEEESTGPEESSLDRRPSYLRKVQGGSISPDPSVRKYILTPPYHMSTHVTTCPYT